MKKLICIMMTIFLLCMMVVPVGAAWEPVITVQPQNAQFPAYTTAIYSVTAEGDDLECNWYLVFEGKTYDLSEADTTQPWEAYAGTTYGPSSKGNTFSYYFSQISPELDGAEIYAEISDGHSEPLRSDSAIISVADGAAPPVTSVPAAVEAALDEKLELECSVNTKPGEKYEFLWYETETGNFEDKEVYRDRTGFKYESAALSVDTSETGTRYYVCRVTTRSGGCAYTSVIPVTVVNKQTVLFTADTSPVPGGMLRVDIDAMAKGDSRISKALQRDDVIYTWYRNGEAIDDRDGDTLYLGDSDVGSEIYVEVACPGRELQSITFPISARERTLPGFVCELPVAVAGEPYGLDLNKNDEYAFYGTWFDYGDEYRFERTGLRLSQDGKLSGTPMVPGTYKFCITTFDADGETTQAWQLTVLKAENREPVEPNTTADPNTPDEPNPPAEPAAPTEPEETKPSGGHHSSPILLPFFAVLAVISAIGACITGVMLLFRKKK